MNGWKTVIFNIASVLGMVTGVVPASEEVATGIAIVNFILRLMTTGEAAPVTIFNNARG